MKEHQMLSVLHVLDRIREARPESPIAVFNDKGTLKAVFGRTVMTDFWIKMSYPPLVGVYDKTFDPVSVKRDLSSVFIHKKEDVLELDE